MTRRGVDVSRYQHPDGVDGNVIGWAALKAAGFDWAAVELSLGRSILNPFAVKDVTAALDAGFEVVVYHYCYPWANVPFSEATFFQQQINKLPAEILLALDVEEGATQLGWKALDRWVHSFATVRPVDFVYWNQNYRANLTCPPFTREWVAAPGLAHPPAGAAVWQTGEGMVPGIAAVTDLDTVLYDRPVPPGPGPTHPKEYLDVNLTRMSVRIERLDGNGNGYVDLVGVSADHVVSVAINGMAYELDPATAPHTYDRVADEVDFYQVADRTRIKVTGGQPGGAIQLWVWVVA